MNYICHSGGCPGADMTWETEGYKYNVKTISYSFWNHVQHGKNQIILNDLELKEGFQNVLKANETLKRAIRDQAPYVKNLLSSNWFQVKNSDAIFAIGKFLNEKNVSGGTGWAIQMSIDNLKPTFMFDQINNKWNKFNYDFDKFEVIDYVPKLTENFAGIGTREINMNGINAIQTIYKNMGL